MARAPDLASDDYYKILGVDKGASDQEIGRAYKKLALKYHPDKNQDDKERAEENFKKITEAYETLRDAEKRKTYDQFGKAGMPGGSGGSGGVSFAQADQVFKAFFGGADPFSVMFADDDDGGSFLGGKGGFPSVVFSTGGMGGKGGRVGMPFGGFDMGGFPGMPGMMGGKVGGRRTTNGSAPMPPYCIPKGTQVVVRDLEKATEHNGKTGRINGWDESKSRYIVELDADTQLTLRPTNLTQVTPVEIVNVESQESYNGQVGEIVGYNTSTGRYTIKLRKKEQHLGLQPSCVLLSRGTRVVVQGLSADAYNGQMGQIKDVDREAQRYTVDLQIGKSIKIKYDNVLC